MTATDMTATVTQLRAALAKLEGVAPATVYHRHDTACIVVELTPAAAAKLSEVLE